MALQTHSRSMSVSDRYFIVLRRRLRYVQCRTVPIMKTCTPQRISSTGDFREQ